MINPNVSAGVTGDKSPGGRHAGTPPMHLPRPAAIFGPARQPVYIKRSAATSPGPAAALPDRRLVCLTPPDSLELGFRDFFHGELRILVDYRERRDWSFRHHVPPAIARIPTHPERHLVGAKYRPRDRNNPDRPAHTCLPQRRYGLATSSTRMAGIYRIDQASLARSDR
jgi:hypothetical protein